MMVDASLQHQFRALLRERFSGFVRKSFRTLYPGVPYLHNWHIDHLAYPFERVARGETKRLIVNMPPRMGKSIVSSIAFPAWCLGRDPAKKIMCISYDRALAETFSAQTRDIMGQAWYRRCFPDTHLTMKRRRELQTSLGGFRFASGRSGDVLGRGADIIILDDPMKPIETTMPRQIVKVKDFLRSEHHHQARQQSSRRDHPRDAAPSCRGLGCACSRKTTTGRSSRFPRSKPRNAPISSARTRTMSMSALRGEPLHVEREPLEVLERTARAMGRFAFEAQYQQAPVAHDGRAGSAGVARLLRGACPPRSTLRSRVRTLGAHPTPPIIRSVLVWGSRGQDFYLLDCGAGTPRVPRPYPRGPATVAPLGG